MDASTKKLVKGGVVAIGGILVGGILVAGGIAIATGHADTGALAGGSVSAYLTALRNEGVYGPTASELRAGEQVCGWLDEGMTARQIVTYLINPPDPIDPVVAANVEAAAQEYLCYHEEV